MRISRSILFLALAVLWPCLGFVMQAKGGPPVQSTNTMIAEKISSDPKTIYQEELVHRQVTISELLNVFTNSSSDRFAKGHAAYYLGQLHASEVVDDLAPEVSLTLLTGHLYYDESPGNGTPVADALVQIGIPSIRPLIRNLEESDKANVRILSLDTLRRIDGDKSIVRLRLEKAVEAQKDSSKKARLQAALKELSQ